MKYFIVLVFNERRQYCSHHALALADYEDINEHKRNTDIAGEITREDFLSSPRFYRDYTKAALSVSGQNFQKGAVTA